MLERAHPSVALDLEDSRICLEVAVRAEQPRPIYSSRCLVVHSGEAVDLVELQPRLLDQEQIYRRPSGYLSWTHAEGHHEMPRFNQWLTVRPAREMA